MPNPNPTIGTFPSLFLPNNNLSLLTLMGGITQWLSSLSLPLHRHFTSFLLAHSPVALPSFARSLLLPTPALALPFSGSNTISASTITPGLSAAAQTHSFLLPLYVFDHRILSRFSDDTLELLLLALENLRNSLKDQGSDLMIRFGSAENVIKQLVKEVKATDVFIEEEVEYEMRQLIGVVKETLETSSSLDGNLDIAMWRTPFYDVKKLKELPASYDDFKKLKLLPTSSLLPATLPVAETKLDWVMLRNS